MLKSVYRGRVETETFCLIKYIKRNLQKQHGLSNFQLSWYFFCPNIWYGLVIFITGYTIFKAREGWMHERGTSEGIQGFKGFDNYIFRGLFWNGVVRGWASVRARIWFLCCNFEVSLTFVSFAISIEAICHNEIPSFDIQLQPESIQSGWKW